MTLKLGPIPDRTPVKISIALPPDVHGRLTHYAKLHGEEYGGSTTPQQIAVLMIEHFLETDTGFKRASKETRKTSHRD